MNLTSRREGTVTSILVVDDDPASVALVEGILEARGYETRSATGLAQALAILKT